MRDAGEVAMTGENVLKSIRDGEPTRPNDSSSFRSLARLRLPVSRDARFHATVTSTLVEFVHETTISEF